MVKESRKSAYSVQLNDDDYVLYPTETTTDADDLALLPNPLSKAESWLHSLEQTVGRIVLNVNANKILFM